MPKPRLTARVSAASVSARQGEARNVSSTVRGGATRPCDQPGQQLVGLLRIVPRAVSPWSAARQTRRAARTPRRRSPCRWPRRRRGLRRSRPATSPEPGAAVAEVLEDELLERDVSGKPSKLNVCTMSSVGRTSWKRAVEPELLAVAACARSGTNRRCGSRSGRCVMSRSRGPSHWTTSSGSVWARNTFSGGASNSRTIRTSGTSGSDDDLGLVVRGAGHRGAPVSGVVAGPGRPASARSRSSRRR